MLKIFSVFDSKVGAYLNPMTMRTAGEAIRAFGAACSDSNHEFYKHAEDFTLFEIGEWDETTGSLLPHHVSVPLGKAIEYASQYREQYSARRDAA